jgi:hypothetical protein
VSNKVHLSDAEMATGFFVINSGVWQTEDHFVWSADHASGWTSSGVSATVDEAQTEIERQFMSALHLSGYEVDVLGVRVNRVHFDA